MRRRVRNATSDNVLVIRSHVTDMALLIAYILILLFIAIWIVRDDETDEVFAVVPNLHFIWFESGDRWRMLYLCGWRLTVLSLLIGGSIALASFFYVVNPFDFIGTTRAATLGFMILSAFAVVSLIPAKRYLRWKRQVLLAVTKLTGFMKRVTTDSDIEQSMERADYATLPPWTAWHPIKSDFKTQQAQGLWDGLVPVVYLRQAPTPLVLVPVNFETFLAWGSITDFTRVGESLPFCGPGGVAFRLISAKKLRNWENWCVVIAEMQ